MNPPLTVPAISNRRLILPYAAPYFAYVGTASLLTDRLSPELMNLLRLVVVSGLIIWAWRWYCPLRGPKALTGSVLWGIGAGLVGLVVWLLLLAPFVPGAGEPPASTTAFLLRVVGASLLVPIFEELMMRGYVFRLAYQWDQARLHRQEEPLLVALDEKDINDVPPGAWSWRAVLIGTAAFTVGHTTPEWPAAIGFSLLMTWLWIIRQDLIACITAHAVTNTALALFVWSTNQWQYW